MENFCCCVWFFDKHFKSSVLYLFVPFSCDINQKIKSLSKKWSASFYKWKRRKKRNEMISVTNCNWQLVPIIIWCDFEETIRQRVVEMVEDHLNCSRINWLKKWRLKITVEFRFWTKMNTVIWFCSFAINRDFYYLMVTPVDTNCIEVKFQVWYQILYHQFVQNWSIYFFNEINITVNILFVKYYVHGLIKETKLN